MLHGKASKDDIKNHPDLKDLNNISISHTLWKEIQEHNAIPVIEQKLYGDLVDYYETLGGLTTFSFRARYSNNSQDSFVAEE